MPIPPREVRRLNPARLPHSLPALGGRHFLSRDSSYENHVPAAGPTGGGLLVAAFPASGGLIEVNGQTEHPQFMLG
jgi:hypothetical protein